MTTIGDTPTTASEIATDIGQVSRVYAWNLSAYWFVLHVLNYESTQNFTTSVTHDLHVLLIRFPPVTVRRKIALNKKSTVRQECTAVSQSRSIDIVMSLLLNLLLSVRGDFLQLLHDTKTQIKISPTVRQKSTAVKQKSEYWQCYGVSLSLNLLLPVRLKFRQLLTAQHKNCTKSNVYCTAKMYGRETKSEYWHWYGVSLSLNQPPHQGSGCYSYVP